MVLESNPWLKSPWTIKLWFHEKLHTNTREHHILKSTWNRYICWQTCVHWFVINTMSLFQPSWKKKETIGMRSCYKANEEFNNSSQQFKFNVIYGIIMIIYNSLRLFLSLCHCLSAKCLTIKYNILKTLSFVFSNVPRLLSGDNW